MLHPFRTRLREIDPVLRTGRVRKIMPTHIEADGPNVTLGTLCRIEDDGDRAWQAEVVRVDSDRVVLTPLEPDVRIRIGARVVACGEGGRVAVGAKFLGRVIDPVGEPLDGGPRPSGVAMYPLLGRHVSPLERESPKRVLATGLRAIDGLLTLGEGQRVGIFAASGVGKTSLMHQITRQAEGDIAVLCLVGERGREVEALWREGLDDTARGRSILVAATSDRSAALRVRAGHAALAHAEYWRDRGKRVLFVLDSVTRLAMAMREVGLAAGEPPTVRAYTPSVFGALPRLVERCGALRAGGAISAIVTVLSESDEVDDPVCELMKSVLDGHIVLSRELAEQGHFPAIDIARSVSRQASALVSPAKQQDVRQVIEWISVHHDARALIDAGLYVKGSNPAIDTAVERSEPVRRFLRQTREEIAALPSSDAALATLARRRT